MYLKNSAGIFMPMLPYLIRPFDVIDVSATAYIKLKLVAGGMEAGK
jgi:hypothetical protein